MISKGMGLNSIKEDSTNLWETKSYLHFVLSQSHLGLLSHRHLPGSPTLPRLISQDSLTTKYTFHGHFLKVSNNQFLSV